MQAGRNATSVNNSIFIGAQAGYAQGAIANVCIIGGAFVSKITQMYVGSGVTHTAPQTVTIQATGGSGTDIAGGGTTIAGGKATGSAAGGSVKIQTSVAGASGSTLQTLADRLEVTAAGNMLFGTTVTKPSASSGPTFCIKSSTGNPTLAGTNAAFFSKDVAGTVEAFAIDSGSAATQLTGHADDAPPAFYEVGPKKGERVGRREIPWRGIVRDGTTYHGLVEWTYEIRRPTGSAKPYTVRESFAQYTARMTADGQMTAEQAATYVPQNVANENTARNTAWQAKRQAWLDELAIWRRKPRSIRGDMPRFHDPKPIPVQVS